ncbi:hypothetical protein DFH06DRAFT_1127049 [Mycena polygramma]|nr:hypothetical protein DFH06DRAFT_1127049 [Mycena polygramma]
MSFQMNIYLAFHVIPVVVLMFPVPVPWFKQLPPHVPFSIEDDPSECGLPDELLFANPELFDPEDVDEEKEAGEEEDEADEQEEGEEDERDDSNNVEEKNPVFHVPPGLSLQSCEI